MGPLSATKRNAQDPPTAVIQLRHFERLFLPIPAIRSVRPTTAKAGRRHENSRGNGKFGQIEWTDLSGCFEASGGGDSRGRIGRGVTGFKVGDRVGDDTGGPYPSGFFRSP